MSNIFAMGDDSADAKLAVASANNINSLDEIQAPWHRGLGQGLFSGVVRGVANLNDLLLTATDLVYPMTDEERDQQDYLRHHALDAWTPTPNEVGRVGQVLGGLGEVAAPLAVGGAPLLVGSSTLAGGKRLVDEGVSAGTAGTAAAIEGAATYAGLKIPIVGDTLLSRLGSGAIGNVAVGTGSRFAEKKLLESQGFAPQAAGFETTLSSVSTDFLTGLLFGGLVHATSPRIRSDLTPPQEDAILTARNAKMASEGTAPGKPVDAFAQAGHAEALRTVGEQLVQGKEANVGDVVARHEGAEFTPNGNVEESVKTHESVAEAIKPPEEIDITHEEGALGDITVKSPNGETIAQEGDKYLMSKHTGTNEGSRSKGEGKARSNYLYNLAQEKGLIYGSDVTLTPDAVAMYRSLAKKGWTVKENPSERGPSGGLVSKDPRVPVFELTKNKVGASKEVKHATKTPATNAPPELTALKQIAETQPDAKVYSGFDEDGKPMASTAAEVHERIQSEYTQALKDAQAYEAAVSCFLAVGA